ncbi:hypothetical protein G3I32_06610 [Streptomyces coelicoflavus]|uniref:Calcium-binding protein n=1 Tax=Streptomyces coelicoflavus TaxID=285562 RepID=A0A7K3PF81_9ACTN|nr:hypothetical protein [Streptomyces coelicoflavus]NEB08547.1 hypothetical protein [Streptomyces coelicoflavus]
MRVRSIVGAVCGAVALSALVVPAAQAEENPITFSGIAINSGEPLVVGTGIPHIFNVHYNVNHINELHSSEAHLYTGSVGEWKGQTDAVRDPSCRELSPTVTRCVQSLAIDPKKLSDNDLAGTWHVYLEATDADYNVAGKGGLYPTTVLRNSVMARAEAAPEPVGKGETLTVTGELTHADWNTHTYVGEAGKSVELQFRSPDSLTYSTVKTVETGSGGALKETLTAETTGAWRWYFAGDGTTSGAVAVGDAVVVE